VIASSSHAGPSRSGASWYQVRRFAIFPHVVPIPSILNCPRPIPFPCTVALGVSFIARREEKQILLPQGGIRMTCHSERSVAKNLLLVAAESRAVTRVSAIQ